MNERQPLVITGSSSIFLDCLRLCAALTVLCLHGRDQWFPLLAHRSNEPGDLAHAAVVVFFVLSGYVIAHTTTANNRGAIQYSVARLSRLCSIVIPALVITAFCELIVFQMDSALNSEYNRGMTLIRYLISGSFLNEIWFYSASPPFNIPLWSLGFEFWYYLIFGLCIYRTGGWKGYILPVIGGFIAGPKILLMMPVWLLGVAAYRIPKLRMEKKTGWLWTFITLLTALLAIKFLPPFPYEIGSKPLFYANQFLTDWFIGVFVGIAIWTVPVSIKASQKTRWTSWFRKAADLTFPIYVLHYPLLILFRAIFDYRVNDRIQLAFAVITVLITSVVLGIIFERHRHTWALFFERIIKSFRTIVFRMVPYLITFPRTT